VTGAGAEARILSPPDSGIPEETLRNLSWIVRNRGAMVLTVLCVIPAILWWRAAPLDLRFSDAMTSLTSISVLLALLGITAFACNLILGARLKVVEALFGGLDRMYFVHRTNGRVAYLLLLGHAILMLSARATISLSSAFDLLTPSAGTTVLLGVIALTVMTVLIIMTLYVRLNHEIFVYVQRTFGLVFILGALHAFRTPGIKALSPLLTYYFLLLAVAALSAWIYRSLLGEVFIKRLDYRVQAVNRLDQSVTEIVMAPEDESLTFIPGQFVFLEFQSDEMRRVFHPVTVEPEGQSAIISFRSGAVSKQAHPFSITSGSGERTLRVSIKSLGDFTRAIRHLEPGAFVRVEGPYGKFCASLLTNRKQVWVAGGIGVTPFLSMARSLDDPELEVDFFYGMERGDEGYFLDELYEIADRHPRLKVIPIKRDKLGFITADDIEAVARPISNKEILICGPPPMIDGLNSQFLGKGLSPRQIHFEKFGFVG
jgi:predicted ferric reductase